MKLIIPIATLLVCVGCGVNVSFAEYFPDSIYTAARSGNEQAVIMHLEKEATQEILDNALGAAVVGESLSVIDLLIERGANVNHLSSWNTSLLNNAIMLGFDKSAAKLIESGANVNVFGYKRKERTYLIDYYWNPLMCAAFKGNNDLIQLLLKHGADPSLQGWSTSPNDIETAADIAAYSGHLKILRSLVKKGTELRSDTIYKAVRGGHLNTLKYLLKKNKDINKLSTNDKSLLMEACWWGWTDIVRFLLKKRADVNLQNRSGSTALIESVSNPDRNLKVQLEIVQLLIQYGANPSVETNGMTALDFAQKNNKKTIVKFLRQLEQ